MTWWPAAASWSSVPNSSQVFGEPGAVKEHHRPGARFSRLEVVQLLSIDRHVVGLDV